MAGLGTLGNMAAILFGSTIGIIFKDMLKQRFQETIMNALGLAVMFIGIIGALQGLFIVNGNKLATVNVMLMIISLALGAFLGEAINIEDKLNKAGEWLKGSLKIKGEKSKSFVEGFVNSSLLFCVGAMAIYRFNQGRTVP